jgi:hypothetical protein
MELLRLLLEAADARLVGLDLLVTYVNILKLDLELIYNDCCRKLT